MNERDLIKIVLTVTVIVLGVALRFSNFHGVFSQPENEYGWNLPEAKRIAWIGNSHTLNYDVPWHVHQLTEKAGTDPVFIKTVAIPGLSLADHLRKGEAAKLIEEEDWDIVILQPGSWDANGPNTDLEKGVFKFSKLIASKTQLILYQNWAYSKKEVAYYRSIGSYPTAVQRRIDARFRKLAKRYQLMIAPSGHAIARSYRSSSKLELVSKDGNHLTRDGAIVSAMVIFRTLFPDAELHIDTFQAEQDPDLLKKFATRGISSFRAK